MKRLLLILALCIPAACQVVQVSAGSSTLYGGQGAGATVYLPDNIVTLGAGYAGGQFVFGAADHFQYHGYAVTAGDRSFGYGDLSLSVRGLSVQRANATQTLAAFVGFTGTTRSLPYFQSTQARRGGAGLYYKRVFGVLELSGLAALDGARRRTALASATYKGNRFGGTVTGGTLAGMHFLNGNMLYSPAQWIHLTAARQDVFSGAQRATINGGGAGVNLWHLQAQAAAYSGTAGGHTVNGQSAGAGLRWGFASATATWYASGGLRVRAYTTAQTFRHWSATQTITAHGIAFGGAYHNNRIMIGLDHGMSFFPFAGRTAWQQTTAVRISLRIPHTAATVGVDTTVLPTGRTLYTAQASDYLNGPLHVQAASQAARARSVNGKYIISGKVTDKDGAPVLGCAVQLGSTRVYSAEDGSFFLRVRKAAPLPVSVPDDAWHVVTATATAQPGAPLNIVVSR